MAGDFLPRNAPAQVLRSGLDFLIRLVGYALIELGQEHSAREQGRENQMATNRSAMTALVFLIASASHNWQSAQADEKATPPPQPGLSTHVLNTATGKPALGVTVILQKQKMEGWEEMSRAETDTQGRVKELQPAGKKLPAGTYRLVFETGAYFKGQGAKSFFPRVDIIFSTESPDEHYHVPLLLSPFGYSTYRGS